MLERPGTALFTQTVTRIVSQIIKIDIQSV